MPPQDINTGIYGNNVTCNIPALLAGQVLLVTITYNPPQELTQPSLINNTAWVYNTPFCDAQPSNNINSAGIQLVNGANLNVQICW